MLDDASQETPSATPQGAQDSGGALTIVPRDLLAEPRQAAESGKALERREPHLESNALVPDEEDAERVAFSMWREGRTDDAIAFLEREILLERDRRWKHDAFADRLEPHFGAPAPKVIVTPPPADGAKPKRRGWRSRNAAPVSEPFFSDASAPTIDLTAERPPVTPLDALPERRMGRGPAIVAAIGLVIVACAAAGNIWDNYRGGTAVEHAAPAMETAATVTASVVPAKAEPTQTASVTPATLDATPAVTIAAVPAASETAAAASLSSAAPTEAATATPADPPIEATAAEEPASATLPAEATPPAGPDEAVALVGPQDQTVDDTVTPPDELDEAATGADGGAMPNASAPIAVARLPRQRPEPPAGLTLAPSQPASVSQVAPSTPIPAQAPQPEAADLPQPFYDSDGLPVRSTLTPAEYQALLERRAMAEDYVARRRAIAEETVPAQRRVLLRLLHR